MSTFSFLSGYTESEGSKQAPQEMGIDWSFCGLSQSEQIEGYERERCGCPLHIGTHLCGLEGERDELREEVGEGQLSFSCNGFHSLLGEQPVARVMGGRKTVMIICTQIDLEAIREAAGDAIVSCHEIARKAFIGIVEYLVEIKAATAAALGLSEESDGNAQFAFA